jgi:biopolymer transport protein ExbB/TolQ
MEGYSIVSFFQKGGLFMYPILLVFLAGMAITVERWFRLNGIRTVNRKIWNVLQPALAKGEFENAKSIISKDDSTISQMLGMGLARMGVVRRREDIEIAMEESMMEIIPQLEKRTPYDEHYGLRADVGYSVTAVPFQADVNHRRDRGQPGNGIGKSSEQSCRF